MAKKRRQRKTARRRKNNSGGRFGAMLFGLFAGLAIASGVWYSTLTPSEPASARAAAEKPARPAATQAAPKPVPLEADGTGYDFYDMLPAQEVVVSDDFAARRRTTERAPAGTEAPLTQAGAYLIQAGSFRSADDADRMKARISLLGMQPRVETVEINDRVFHRVRIGPVNNLDRLDDFRRRLRTERIDIQVIRVDD